MKRLKKILFLALMVAALSCLFCQPAFAISEEEVQAQVDAVGKEAVSGNVLIWCHVTESVSKRGMEKVRPGKAGKASHIKGNSERA